MLFVVSQRFGSLPGHADKAVQQALLTVLSYLNVALSTDKRRKFRLLLSDQVDFLSLSLSLSIYIYIFLYIYIYIYISLFFLVSSFYFFFVTARKARQSPRSLHCLLI